MRPLTSSEEELLKKYRTRLERELGGKKPAAQAASSSYQTFKQEQLPRHLSLYETLCNSAYRLIKIKPSAKSGQQLAASLQMSHLDIAPGSVYSLAVLVLLGIVFASLLGGFFVFGSLFLTLYGLVAGLLVMMALLKLPEFFANNWRLKASNQMVQCIFYVVTYMRHTSNIEQAVRFASDHLTAPLSLDLRKVMWDVETGKHESVKESLDGYLDTWKEYNPEFIEAFHLIEGSLVEPAESKRLELIDKALKVMLEETYEKMLRYTHDLKSPITMLYMLGIILPVLGLVILPLIASFMTSDVSPLVLAAYIALLYNVSLPILIYYLGRMVLSKRPTGYGEMDISEQYPQLKKLGRANVLGMQLRPAVVAGALGGALLIIGLIPFIMGMTIPDSVLLSERAFDDVLQFKLLGYRTSAVTGEVIGPYGLGAAVLSLFLPLALGLGLGTYFMLRSKNIIKIRTETKKLEQEFASGLFQLGNRLSDGMPLEIAFEKVAVATRGSRTGSFFETASLNLQRRGMSTEQALFDRRFGAVAQFPSAVIESSMKVLLESARKGPKIAAQAMINVSEYIKDIHRVDERLNDLLAELISDMKQQIKVLAPAIAGIVVGITSMIVAILGRLSDQLTAISSNAQGASQVPTGLITLFGDGIPTYYFQAIVGLYIVQMVYILTVMVSGIESGSDKLAERYSLGQNLTKSTLIYVVIALVVVVMFNVIAGNILSSLAST